MRQREIIGTIFRDIVFFSDASQVDGFHARDCDYDLVVSGRTLRSADIVFYSGRPRHFEFFARQEKEANFVQAEWDAVISLYIHKMQSVVVNHAIIGNSRSFIQGSTAKRQVAQYLGMELTPSKVRIDEENTSVEAMEIAKFTVFVSHCDFCLSSGAPIESPDLAEFANGAKRFIWELGLQFLIFEIDLAEGIRLTRVSCEFSSAFSVETASKLLARSLGLA